MSETVTYTFRGMNNVADPLDVGAPVPKIRRLVFTEGVAIVNADPDNDRGARLRPGRIAVLAGNAFHSGWSNPSTPSEAYFANGPLLNRLKADGSVEVVKFDLIPNIPLAFCQVNEAVAWSNGLQWGVIEDGRETEPWFPSAPYKERMVAGEFLEFYNGRLYALKGNVLYCSDSLDAPGGIESMDTRQNVVAVFDGPGRMLQRVDDGLFVSAGEETFFLAGRDAVMEGGFAAFRSVAPYPAVPGTARPVKAELLGIEGLAGWAALWVSSRGICIGGAGGVFINRSEERVSIGEAEAGTALVREQNGLVHYVTALRGTAGPFNAYQPRDIEVDEVAL